MSLEPSRVIFVKNVSESSKEQLMQFLQQFGTVTNTAWLHNIDKALVEFERLESAENLIRMYQSGTPVTIDGKPASFAFSKSQRINTSVNQKVYAPPGSQRILHCNIHDPWYNITVDVIKSIMERFGPIQRIVIFTKNTLQVLVEFETAESARAALEALDGKDIYPDCCKLKIEFSRQERLNVHYNNQKQWDFTASLPRGPEETGAPMTQAPFMTTPVDMQQWGARPQLFPQFLDMGMMPMQPIPPPTHPDVHSVMPPAQLYPTQQLMGQYRPAAQPSRQPAMPSTSPSEVPVVMITNLQPHLKEQHIFNFASVYGVVEKVKNLGQGRMLCQMRNPVEAKRLIDALNTVTLRRNRVRAEASRHATIKDGSGETYDRAIDFTGSPFNRFKEGSTPLPPSKTIIFTVGCRCKESDIAAALKAVDSPEPSEIVINGKKDTDGAAEPSADTDEDKKTDASSEALTSSDSVTTGTISCANTGIAAEIMMMANNAPVREMANLELCFASLT